MKTQHTPGPWSVNRKLKSFVDAGPDGGGLIPICECNQLGEMPTAEGEANAALIASAPELLAALETMLCADNAICENIGLKSYQAMQRIAAIDYAREVIAKAKGAK